MPTVDTVILRGKSKWAKFFVPSMYFKYSTELNLDSESVSIVLDLKKKGIKNTIKSDNDGYWITLSKPSEIDVKGHRKSVEPPLVFDKDGQPWNKDKSIGNGSDLACKCLVREYTIPGSMPKKTGIAIRLESVRVDNLVTFDVNKDLKQEDKAKVEGLMEHPASEEW